MINTKMKSNSKPRPVLGHELIEYRQSEEYVTMKRDEKAKRDYVANNPPTPIIFHPVIPITQIDIAKLKRRPLVSEIVESVTVNNQLLQIVKVGFDDSKSYRGKYRVTLNGSEYRYHTSISASRNSLKEAAKLLTAIK